MPPSRKFACNIWNKIPVVYKRTVKWKAPLSTKTLMDTFSFHAALAESYFEANSCRFETKIKTGNLGVICDPWCVIHFLRQRKQMSSEDFETWFRLCLFRKMTGNTIKILWLISNGWFPILFIKNDKIVCPIYTKNLILIIFTVLRRNLQICI